MPTHWSSSTSKNVIRPQAAPDVIVAKFILQFYINYNQILANLKGDFLQTYPSIEDQKAKLFKSIIPHPMGLNIVALFFITILSKLMHKGMSVSNETKSVK